MADMGAIGWLSLGSSFLSAWGQLQGGRSARIAGERQKAAAEFEAIQEEEQAGIALAISQRQAAEEARQGRYQASRALAVAASSGGGVSDPTIINLIARSRGEAVYRSNVALYEGEAQARKLRLQAAATRITGADLAAEGVSRQTGALFSAVGTVAKTGLSLYAKYGMKGPVAGPATGGSGDANLLMTPDGTP